MQSNKVKPKSESHPKTNTVCCFENQVISLCQTELESFWSQLPEEVIERILLWLPVASKVKFKSVCTKWKYLLQSDTYYSRKYQIEHAKQPWFFLCTTGKFSCAFDFQMNRWHRMPNPAIPRSSILAAAGNILCLGNLVADCKVLSVCNPLRKALKQLPPMSRVQLIHKTSITLHKDEEVHSYKIMVAGEEQSVMSTVINSRVYRLYTEIYDSRNGNWRMASNPLPHAKFGSDPGVWCNGLFYCITEMPYGVVTFDLQNGAWTELGAVMPCSIATPSLVEYRGQVILIGRVVENNQTQKIKIWQLQNSKSAGTSLLTWAVFQEMPSSIFSKFTAPLAPYSPLLCSAVGDWLCISTHLSLCPLAFNFCNKTWKWLPGDPLFPGKRTFHLLGLCFDPVSESQL
ncbi:hypothetical protein SUGI_0105100 [Cryptomeria japonica]|uniref:F-box/kelch-repeat protein At5g15710 n=1 Tax=Cryptomeria japonica TaxID=3369 RepID=UPI0024089DED|nr:F-box/kelch-repeat protein At5g15710 [Cryptomeria japonica]GLJ09263.1 hypothetical protein SUGI_0105100 [Cryptomeria japonica]